MRLRRKIMASVTAAALAVTSLVITAPAENAADGLKILDGTYRESDYYKQFTKNGTRPLDIANDFHLFAFNSIALYAHCNGNFAAPNVDATQASGTNQFEPNKGDPSKEGTGTSGLNGNMELSIATESIKISGTTLVNDLLIPVRVLVKDQNGENIGENGKLGHIQIDGNWVDMNSQGDKHIYHVNPDYIDFKAEQAFYMNLSAQLSKQASNNAGVTSENGKTDVVLKEEGMNVYNVSWNDLNSAQNGFSISNAVFENGRYTGKQSIVINVDMAAAGETPTTNFQVQVNRTDNSQVHNQESNVLDGTIVLWNFYDSSSSDGMYHGTITYGKTSLGSILAPCAKIEANQNIDGNIIANDIVTRAESHRCDFMGPISVTSKPSNTPAPTKAPTNTPVPTKTPTNTPVPTKAPTNTPVPTKAPTNTPVPTEAPTNTPVPTEAPTNTPVPTKAPTNTPVPTKAPTNTPVPTKAPTNTPVPTEAPTNTPVPTEAPTNTPVPTKAPTNTPVPTEAPTNTPVPTEAPTNTPVPTEAPTAAPTEAPTTVPTEAPTKAPDVLGELELTVKQDDKNVPGEEFEVKDSKGDTVGEFVTDEEGKITVPDLPAGDYTLEAKKRPGSVLGDDIPPLSFTVEAGGKAKGTITVVTDSATGKKSMVLGDLVYENDSTATPILGISDMPQVFGIMIMTIGAMLVLSAVWMAYRRRRA